MQSCVCKDIIPEEPTTEITGVKNSTSDKIDNVLNFLGFIKEPAKSLKDVNTITFKTDDAKYYLQPYKITQKDIIIHHLKINSDKSYEKTSIFVYPKGEDLLLKAVVNDKLKETQISFKNETIYQYKKQNENWEQASTIKKKEDGTVYQELPEGTEKEIYDIKNNEGLPEGINFKVIIEPWSKINDVFEIII